MARWKTHHRRADKKHRMSYARFKYLRKIARFGFMCGMGTQIPADAFAKISMTARDASFHLESFRGHLFYYTPQFNTRIPIVHSNYAEQERRALVAHRFVLDATIIPKDPE